MWMYSMDLPSLLGIFMAFTVATAALIGFKLNWPYLFNQVLMGIVYYLMMGRVGYPTKILMNIVLLLKIGVKNF